MTTQTKPIDLYYSASPNGRKITIMLQELGVPFTLHYLHFSRRDQHTPEYLAINPNNKIPAIVDPEGPGGEPITVFETGAILKYLGDKFGRFYSADPRTRTEIDVWLTWSVASFAPFIGQLHHFYHDAPEQIPYAIARYEDYMHRLYKVLNDRLADREWIAAGEYTIADISTFGWVHRYTRHKLDLALYPNVKRWFETILARPAVEKGLSVPTPPKHDDPAEHQQANTLRYNQD